MSRYRCWSNEPYRQPPVADHLEVLRRVADEVGGRLVGNAIVIASKNPAQPVQSRVYFIGGEVGAIKIGVSTKPESRLVALQTGSPIPLAILATVDGGIKLERAYHQQFAAHRLTGEWFERAPEILAEIDRLSTLPPSLARGERGVG